MVKILSIQRIGPRGVIQYVSGGNAYVADFPASLSDAEAKKRIPGLSDAGKVVPAPKPAAPATKPSTKPGDGKGGDQKQPVNPKPKTGRGRTKK